MAKRSGKSQQEAVTQGSSVWWIFLLHGLLSVFIGWLLLARPVNTILTLVQILGIYWLIGGIFEIIVSLTDIGHKGSSWGWKLVGGMIGVFAGLVVLNNPLFTGVFTPIMFMYIIAFSFIFNGIARMISGSDNRNTGQYEWSWASFFMGIFYLIFGFYLLTMPTFQSVAIVVFASGILALAGGIVSIIFAFKIKSTEKSL